MIPELMMIVALWVVVPLGVQLTPSWPLARGRWLLGALLGTAAVGLPPGLAAGALAAGWVGVTLPIAWAAAVTLWRGDRRLPSILRTAAGAQLLVGSTWWIASRGGLTPMGFQEPIVALTAVHFHFAGLAAPLLAAETLERLTDSRAARVGALLLLGGVPLLAAGFVIGPHVKLAAALALSIGLVTLAVATLPRLHRLAPAPRRLLRLAWTTPLVSMALAVVYAVGEFTGGWWLTLPTMALTHGLLNALGFATLGMLGWRLTR